MGSSLDYPVNWFPEDLPRPLHAQLSIEEAGLGTFDEDVRLISPLSLEGEGYRQREAVYVTLHVLVDAEYVCGRCLDPIGGHLETTFEMLYRPVAMRPPYLEAEDETGLGYYEGGIIALGEDVRRYLLLELPLWRVCSADCRGLCPRCGVNLSREKCDCATEQHDRSQSELARKLDQLLT